MRAKALGALLALTLVPAVAFAEQADACCNAYCAPVANRPHPETIGGEPYVSAVVGVECAVAVDSITVSGSLQLNGSTATSATKTCRDTHLCRIVLKRRNPPGQQSWRSVANGSYVRWGQRHALWVVYSPTLTA